MFRIGLKIFVLSRYNLSQSKICFQIRVLQNAENILSQLKICLRFVSRFVYWQESIWANQIFVWRFVYCQESIWANQILNWKLSILHQRQLASIVELYVQHIYIHIYILYIIYIWTPLFCGTTYILYIWRNTFHTHCSSTYYVPRCILCSYTHICIYTNSPV